MNDELTNEEIPEDANLPATKRDIAVVKKEIHDSAAALRTEIKDERDVLSLEMKEIKDEILRYFDVVIENIEDSFRGANADEISLIKTNLGLHGERLDTIEERVGLR
jgi:hypothetical protein